MGASDRGPAPAPLPDPPARPNPAQHAPPDRRDRFGRRGGREAPAMSRDPFTRLVEEHHRADALVARLATADGMDRQAALDELEDLLDGHLEREEAALHPIVQQHDADAAREAQVEHGLIRDALDSVRQLAALPGFTAAVDMLGGVLHHHVEGEERDLFPRLGRELTVAELDDLAAALAAETPA